MIYCLWVAKLRQNLKLLPKGGNMALRFKKHRIKKCQVRQNNSTVAMHLGRKVKGQALTQRAWHRRNLRARLNTITVSVLIGITRSKAGRLLAAYRIATFPEERQERGEWDILVGQPERRVNPKAWPSLRFLGMVCRFGDGVIRPLISFTLPKTNSSWKCLYHIWPSFWKDWNSVWLWLHIVDYLKLTLLWGWLYLA